MAEAPITLSPTPPSNKALAQLRVTLAFAAHTRARQVAMNHAKRKLQAQGLKRLRLHPPRACPQSGGVSSAAPRGANRRSEGDRCALAG